MIGEIRTKRLCGRDKEVAQVALMFHVEQLREMGNNVKASLSSFLLLKGDEQHGDGRRGHSRYSCSLTDGCRTNSFEFLANFVGKAHHRIVRKPGRDHSRFQLLKAINLLKLPFYIAGIFNLYLNFFYYFIVLSNYF